MQDRIGGVVPSSSACPHGACLYLPTHLGAGHRGHYCPKEHQQHLELAAFYPKIALAHTQIATSGRRVRSQFGTDT